MKRKKKHAAKFAGGTIFCIAFTIGIYLALKPKTRVDVINVVDTPLTIRNIIHGHESFQLNRWREIIGVEDNTLHLGTGRMEWSSGGSGSGYLYTWDAISRSNMIWEFAPCKRQRLNDVTAADLDVEFCRANSPVGHTAFGWDWYTNSVCVSDGWIILARHVNQTNLIYALQSDHAGLRKTRWHVKVIDVHNGTSM